MCRGPEGSRAGRAAPPDRQWAGPGADADPCAHPAQGQPGEGGARWSDEAIARALDVHPTTVARVRRQFVDAGLDAALARQRPDRVYARVLDGAAEARLVALACSDPPTGREQWTLRRLADELVRLEVVETVSHETVRRTLQQTNANRG